MITTGTRHLKDITDDELAMILNISHLYGAKEFWGEPKITRINITGHRSVNPIQECRTGLPCATIPRCSSG